ncbi:MAG TPA: inositol monophosphatase [Terriglobia bacterium]|jgi:fructose-1,6-bisphosphatase/inositol monophosphatase family enzyme
MLSDIRELLEPLRDLHDRIRDTVLAACERQQMEELAGVERETAGDTIYSIDAISEGPLLEFFSELRRQHAFVLIAEGLERDSRGEASAEWRIIVDPIDGTRGLMYQKRSAWILTGVAPNRGDRTSLEDIVLAVQTEIPLVKQHLSDQLWAIKGSGVQAERLNRLTRERLPFRPRPSEAKTIAHGFAMISRFFPGVRDELAAIDEEIVTGALGPLQPGKAHCFEDQYISTGGQLYELIMGHDRFVADLRPLMEQIAARRGRRLGICCHPYDLCSALIAREAGVIVTDPKGAALRAPLDVMTDVAWAGYANASIHDQIQPLLEAALRKRGL